MSPRRPALAWPREQARTRNVGARRARTRGMLAWFWVVFWLIFLVQPVTENIADGGRRTAGALLLLAGAAVYVPVIAATMRRLWSGTPRTRSTQAVVATSALVVAACMLSAAPLIGQDAFALLPYSLVIFMLGMTPLLGAALALSVVTATASLSHALTGSSLQPGLLFAAVASGLASGLGAFSAERTRDAEAAREDAALLRVQDERNRMARDLHDILGHSLTVITMKAELAGKLVDVDPEKAKTQIAELEQLARGALADVRTTVSGYREMSLSGELARARRAFADASIAVDLPRHVDDVSPDLRELFAWAVREATTNVIRHAGASHVTIALTPTRLSVRDDGRGAAANAGDGNGLTGLRERAAAVGAVVETRSDDGFTLDVLTRDAPASGSDDGAAAERRGVE